MNFLGHFFLSSHDPDLIVGNFIADFVKGKQYLNYPTNIATGIIMHRNIDYFTDNHEVFRKGKRRLFSEYRHYSGVIQDMYYDHFLAKNWSEYDDRPLEQFSQYIYQTLEEKWQYLPEKSQYMFPYMKSGNWLVKYATIEGIGKSLNGMSKRLNNNSKLELATKNLTNEYDEFQAEFSSFMLDLKEEFRNY